MAVEDFGIKDVEAEFYAILNASYDGDAPIVRDSVVIVKNDLVSPPDMKWPKRALKTGVVIAGIAALAVAASKSGWAADMVLHYSREFDRHVDYLNGAVQSIGK